MLGFLTAKRVAELGRAAFFPTPDADLPVGRSPELQEDDRTPQFGFVGATFSDKRILLLGINPGNGPNERTLGDARMMPALVQFAKEPIEENFARASDAYMAECRGWPMWKRHCSEVMGAGKLSFEDVAYANCLPWRTASQSRFDDGVAGRASQLFVNPLLEELNPTLIIAMGKRAAEILELAGPPFADVIVWNRAQAATAAVKRERAQAASRILALLG